MEPLASPIHIPLIPSKAAANLIYGGHLFLAFVLLTAFPLSLTTIAATACIGLSACVQYLSRAELAARLDAILLGSNGQWSVLTRAGEIVPARTSGSPFVSSWFLVLSLKPRGQHRAHIVLAHDNTQPDALRRLRVRLRVPMT